MTTRFLFVLTSALLTANYALVGASTSVAETQHAEVSMRMIGHQILLSVGDSTSRVLPVEKEGNSYRVQFDAEFPLDPDGAAAIIDSVVAATNLATHYIVEFRLCQTQEVVHSYELDMNAAESSVIPCRSREQPKACYELLLTILRPESVLTVAEFDSTEDYSEVYVLLALLVSSILVLLILIFLLRRRQLNSSSNPNEMRIGEFQFNKRKMELTIGNERIELTSKEADLLELLSNAANETVEREEILRTVWDDEGAYVGRTLDVFISKLRKKLEADPNVRIVNVRGIGYKLVVGD